VSRTSFNLEPTEIGPSPPPTRGTTPHPQTGSGALARTPTPTAGLLKLQDDRLDEHLPPMLPLAAVTLPWPALGVGTSAGASSSSGGAFLCGCPSCVLWRDSVSSQVPVCVRA